MPAFTVLGTSRLGAEPACSACGAGATVSFNWSYAQERRSAEDVERIKLFAEWKSLRRGALYHCRVCQAVWHLDGRSERMTHVNDGRIELVLAWDAASITLPPDLARVVQQIGPTPPDIYGNGRERRVTPCTVKTSSGETFERAMICVQADAPVEDHMRYRLGSEIASIHESTFALPAEVRRASSLAQEMRMGFYPTLIEMPDGRRFVMNGMTSFMLVDGYAAKDAQVTNGSYFQENVPPDFIETPRDIVYFIVDGEPGWVAEELATVDTSAVSAVPKRRAWLSRLFGR